VAVGATEATATTMAVPKLDGTIGPGFTISLKNAHGKKVQTLKHGKYTFVVRDKANIHNFTLTGPGIKNKTVTGTSFVGTKTVTLTLKTGKYRFYCTVHPTITGTFKVT
jgi:plastocyanin